MLVVCRAQDEPALLPLLEGLSNLHLARDVDLLNLEQCAALIEKYRLNPSFALKFERDQLVLCKADRRGRFAGDTAALDTGELLRRTGSVTELQRACLGAAAGRGVRVLDVFAGWGVDALALATRGAQVQCVELQSHMVALLRDAQRRVPADIAQLISVAQGDAINVLRALDPGGVDVIYLDPMFPARKKGALPGKRLQWLAELAGARSLEVTVAELIALAAAKAGRTVVLKRRRKDPVTGKPVRQVVGSSVRYDVYGV